MWLPALSHFSSFQMKVIDQGQIQNNTSRKLVGIQTLAQGHFSRECVYPQRSWTVDGGQLVVHYTTLLPTLPGLCVIKSLFILCFFSLLFYSSSDPSSPLLSSPLVPLCPFARKWGDWLHFKPCRNTKATAVHMLPVENVQGIKFTLCVSRLSYNPHTNTAVDIHVYWPSTCSPLKEKRQNVHKNKTFHVYLSY